MWCAGSSLQGRLLLLSVGSREWRRRSCSSCALAHGFSSCGAPGLSCSVAWGSSWTRDRTHYLLHWQVDSLLLSHQGNHSYYICFIMFRKHSTDSSPKFSSFGISSGISIVYAFIYLIFSCQSLPFFFLQVFFLYTLVCMVPILFSPRSLTFSIEVPYLWLSSFSDCFIQMWYI